MPQTPSLPPPRPTQTEFAAKTKTSHAGAIVGGVVGGLVAISVVLLVFLWLYMKHRARTTHSEHPAIPPKKDGMIESSTPQPNHGYIGAPEV